MDAPAIALHHLAVVVRDLDRATRFYRDVLGLPEIRRWDDAKGAWRSVWLALGDSAFLAVEKAAPDAPDAPDAPYAPERPAAAIPGFHCLALGISPSERAAWRARLAQAGVAVERESAYTIYFRDPEHNLVGLQPLSRARASLNKVPLIDAIASAPEISGERRYRSEALVDTMAISLNHTIVPVREKEAAARFFSRIFGLEMGAPHGAFVPVRVDASLTFDFADAEGFEPHHYAFLVAEDDLDAIFARLQRDGISHSADPYGQELGRINHRKGGRGFYFRDPDGHVLEVLTRA